MTLDLFTHAHDSNIGTPGFSLAHSGSTLIVAHTNAEASNGTAPLDPWNLYAGANGNSSGNTNHQYVRPIEVPSDSLYANVYHIWQGTGTPTTRPKVQVFGMLPKPSGGDGKSHFTRAWPADVDSFYFANPDRQWILLEDPDETNDDMEITGLGARLNSYSGPYTISKKRTVYLQGTTILLVGVTTASSGDAYDSGSFSFSQDSSGSSSSPPWTSGEPDVSVIAVQFSG